MKSIVISTENTCDMPWEFLEQRSIAVANMHYFLDGKEYDGTEEFDSKFFYDAMRKGASTKTSLVNEYCAEEHLRNILESGKDVVHIGFASACSGSILNFKTAAEKLNKLYPNKAYVVDSMCESSGQGLLVTLADNFANEGKSAQEVYEYAEKMKHRINHYFCVENIKYLARGGRVSKVAAFIGGIMNIKPVLYTDYEGKLIALNKEISRKKSLLRLVDYMRKKYNGESDIVYISAADCDEDAKFVAEAVQNEFGLTPQIMPLGAVIGSHSGPGTVALFFTSNNRDKE
ncbi:MAG: DegV family protein [Corallococcus sp.]|nr:DegV family protein [Corallococcus sp.]